jgi:transposase InsO family protein
MPPRKRRHFTAEQKATAVEIVKMSGRPISQVAREMDLTESALRKWIQQAEIDTQQDSQGPLTSQERLELQRLRRELKRAEMERDFLTAGALSGRQVAGGRFPRHTALGTPPFMSSACSETHCLKKSRRLSRRLQRSVPQPPEPDRAWCTDIPYIPTAGGWLYLAVILDLFSRRVVGWSMAQYLRCDLVLEALHAALGQRVPASAGLLLHSDQGTQYSSSSYQQALSQAGMTCSMSRRGNCWDNAVAESFFSTLKIEWVYCTPLMAPQAAKVAIAEWIEVFYNRQRRHSILGFLSPVQFEQQYLTAVKLNAAA